MRKIFKMTNQLYYYAWGNDRDAVGRFRKKRFKGRQCRVIVKGNMNSCLVEFVDNGEQLNCSRNALRKVKR